MSDDQSTMLDSAYERAVPHEIPSLFTNFFSSSTILRIARFNGELGSEDDGETLDHFFTLLNTIENNFHAKSHGRRPADDVAPFIIVVEGLDGTGKSSLVEALAQELSTKATRCIATRTPSKALKAARTIFDKRGGAVARAFYMVCNYVLQHEIQQEQLLSSSGGEQSETKHLAVVVDRWYSSTCAYSIGQHTQGGSKGIDALQDDSLFQWPPDLELPALVLLLEADNKVRSQRVRSRNLPVDLSEWDDRLARNEQLCQRIQQSFKRVTGPRETIVLDANQSKEEVLRDALSVVKERVRRHFTPHEYFKEEPLEYLKWHMLEGAQASVHINDQAPTMVLTIQEDASSSSSDAPKTSGSDHARFPLSTRFVKVIKLESAGIVFTTPAGSSLIKREGCLVSLSWQSESNNKQQYCWTMNGVCSAVTKAECTLLRIPTSELNNDSNEAEMYRCCPIEVSCFSDGDASAIFDDTSFVKRRTVTGWIDVAKASESVLSSVNNTDDNDDDKTGAVETQLSPKKAITLVLVGTHCSGKSTISKRLAEVLEWSLDPELGDILRDKDQLVAGGHAVGDGSGIENQQSTRSWDERILVGECERDRSRRGIHRVVETHHLGNLTWAGLRKQSTTEESMEELCRPYRQAMNEAMDLSSVVVVRLKIDVETALRRRSSDESNRLRLPFTDEEAECTSIHTALQTNGLRLMRSVKPDGVPFLEIDNSVDGQEGMEETLQRILVFLNNHRWLACLN